MGAAISGLCCTSAIGWVCTRRWPAPGRSRSADLAQRTGTTMQISGSLFVTTDYGLPVKPD